MTFVFSFNLHKMVGNNEKQFLQQRQNTYLMETRHENHIWDCKAERRIKTQCLKWVRPNSLHMNTIVYKRK